MCSYFVFIIRPNFTQIILISLSVVVYVESNHLLEENLIHMRILNLWFQHIWPSCAQSNCTQIPITNTNKANLFEYLMSDTYTQDTVTWYIGNSLQCLNLLALRWRHIGRESVSNHQPHDYLLSRLITHRSKKISKLRVTGLWAGYSPVNSPYEGPVTRKKFQFDDVIMENICVPKDLLHDRATPSHPFCYLLTNVG